MVDVSRRRLLTAVLPGVASGFGGCLRSSGSSTRTDASDRTKTPAGSVSPDRVTTGSTTTDLRSTPPDVETPAPGQCTATEPPHPTTGDGLPDPRDYPDKPDTGRQQRVREFLVAYESAFVFNSVLALKSDSNCEGRLDVQVDEVTVTPAGSGFTGRVLCSGGFTRSDCDRGTHTPTPDPYGEFLTAGRYYVTNRFLLRNSDDATQSVADDFENSVVLECW